MRVISGTVFTCDPAQPWAECVVTDGRRIVYVGSADGGSQFVAGRPHEHIATGSGICLPGVIDAHTHLQGTGSATRKALLRDAADLDAIARRLIEWADANPDERRIVGLGWQYSAIPGGSPTAAMIDSIIADRPVYLDAFDFHSTWVNSAALHELGITDATPNPIGGEIRRDHAGRATGYLLETAATDIAWPVMNAADDRTRDQWMRAASQVYTAAGVTTAVDMGLDSRSLAALVRTQATGEFALRVIAHWFIDRTGDPETELAQVAEALRLASIHRSDRLRITGIKIIVDGTIDACTAAMLRPYTTGLNADPIWDDEALRRVVVAADAAELQVAMHAIGDAAVRSALDALEHAAEVNGTSGRRHRIEHLVYADSADIPRLGALGVTASMQPVHLDPATLANWAAMLGPSRSEQGFAWPEYVRHGATLALGTDAPTANHEPLPNLYIAATRCSPTHRDLPGHRPDWALPLEQAIIHTTREAARASCVEDRLGMIRVGHAADLVVIDHDPIVDGPASLLTGRVLHTIIDGVTVFAAAAC